MNYCLDKDPSFIGGAFKTFENVLLHNNTDRTRMPQDCDTRTLTRTQSSYNSGNNYTRGLKFSPGGDFLMVNAFDNFIRIFDCPIDSQLDKEILPCCHLREGSIIYDFDWMPAPVMLGGTAVNLIASTSQHNPVHLWNTTTGALHATYQVKNHCDEMISAHSLIFVGFMGQKLIVGMERTLKMFDTERPTTLTREAKLDRDSQNGIISCLCSNPIDYNLFFAGSYARQIGLYDLRETLVPQSTIVGQKGGLTHLKMSSDGQILFSGGRKDSEILCWDIRNLGRVVDVIKRQSMTNQRMYFDTSPDDMFLASGGTDGHVSIWELSEDLLTSESPSDSRLQLRFLAHNDCTNGVAFHPSLPLLASISGQRHLPQMTASSEDESDHEAHNDKYLFRKAPSSTIENSLKFWNLSGCFKENNV